MCPVKSLMTFKTSSMTDEAFKKLGHNFEAHNL
jgi:hypothetical protein